MRTVKGKVVVLGSPGVGKTTMMGSSIGNVFGPYYNTTVGASFYTSKIVVAGIKVKLQIWDPVGPEQFRWMSPLYFRKADAALLVFDITKYRTFRAVKHWVKELKRNVEEPMILCLIGNKIDLASQRRVAKEEALAFATRVGGIYYETSALLNQCIRLSEDPASSTIRVFE